MAKYNVIWRIERDGKELKAGSVVEGDLDYLIGKGLERIESAADSSKQLKDMSVDELEEYAKEQYGVDLDKRKSKKNLIAEINALEEAAQ